MLQMKDTTALAYKKPVQDCKVNFAVVYGDRLDNQSRLIHNPLPDKGEKST
jgi:hypothetical protein